MYNVKGTLSYEQLMKLTVLEGNKYVSKVGNDYIDGLSSVFNLVNRNDKPFTIDDIKRQPQLKDFTFSGVSEFVYIADLKAKPLELTISGRSLNRSNEKIEVVSFASRDAKDIFNKSMGVSYLLTAVIDNKEHIIKIGQSRTSFKSRLGSYNCGTVNNWRTASTTNIKMLQSMLATRALFKLYINDCSHEVVTYTWHGIESVPFASSKALAIEDIMLKKFTEQFGFKPLANIQSNATEIF